MFKQLKDLWPGSTYETVCNVLRVAITEVISQQAMSYRDIVKLSHS